MLPNIRTTTARSLAALLLVLVAGACGGSSDGLTAPGGARHITQIEGAWTLTTSELRSSTEAVAVTCRPVVGTLRVSQYEDTFGGEFLAGDFQCIAGGRVVMHLLAFGGSIADGVVGSGTVFFNLQPSLMHLEGSGNAKAFAGTLTTDLWINTATGTESVRVTGTWSAVRR